MAIISKDLQLFAISTGTMLRFLAILAGLAFLYYIRDIMASLIFAVVVASSMEPAIVWLRAYRLPRILGVILIYLAIALAVFFSIYLVFPLIFEEFEGLATTYPAIQEQVLSGIGRVEILPFSSLLTENIEALIRLPAGFLIQLGGGVANFAGAVFGGVFSFILVIIFSFYLAVQEKGIERFLRLITPLSYEPYVIDLWGRSQRAVGRWIRAQLLLGAIVGVLIFFGLTVLGVRHALTFAILAGIFELIPVAGPIFAAVPAVAVAFLSSPLLGLIVVGLYILVQQFESNVIVPVVMQKAVGLSPLIVVLALLVGARVGGFFGLLLAVPITAIVAEVVNDWDKKKRELMPE